MWPFTRKTAEESNYVDITTRLMAFALDLAILLFFIYYITAWVVSAYYPEGTQLQVLIAVATSEHPELEQNGIKLIQYLLLKHPNEMREYISQMIFSYSLQLLIIGIYVVIFTYKYGATPGKKFTGIRVVDNITGGKLTLSQTIIRYLGYIISILPLGLGIIWGGFHKRKRCWHDFIADTVVIYDENRWYKKYFNKLKAYFNLK